MIDLINGKPVYTKIGKLKVKVGTFTFDPDREVTVFKKNKPHYMRVLDGYGIQRYVEDSKGKEFDIQTVFNKHKNTKIVIEDPEKGVYLSEASDWLKYAVSKNYGNGQQMFLSIKYMTEVQG